MSPAFDFIVDSGFRQSLERDYEELARCVEAKAWKSVHVLAGCIIEALLIDYLDATDAERGKGKDPLRLDLGEAIALCRTAKVLTARTADLSSVVRSYRNLIHPGRVKRLGEPLPTAETASIARSLVDVIIDEVATVRRSTFGLTAEQIADKLERDTSALGFLRELLQDVNAPERERLLIEVIPKRHRMLKADPFGETDEAAIVRLCKAFRVIRGMLPEDVRTRVAGEFVKLLREADGDDVLDYRRAFFAAQDIEAVPERHRRLVVQHYLATCPAPHDESSAAEYEPLGAYLAKADVPKWMDPFIRTLISPAQAPSVCAKVKGHFLNALIHTSPDIDRAIAGRVDAWLKHIDGDESDPRIVELEKLKQAIPQEDLNDLPF